jgi:hypothetical protein
MPAAKREEEAVLAHVRNFHSPAEAEAVVVLGL